MKKATMRTNAFNRLIEATKAFKSKFHTVPVHTYIRLEFHADFDEAIAVAVDGYRLSVEHAVANSEEDFVLYVQSNVKLPKDTDVEFELADGEAIIRCDGFIFGYKQPKGEFINWRNVIPTSDVQYKIGFNGEYLLSALQAAKASVGGRFKTAVFLEFRNPTEPIILRTNENDVKMVLPIRIKE